MQAQVSYYVTLLHFILMVNEGPKDFLGQENDLQDFWNAVSFLANVQNSKREKGEPS